MAWSEKAIEAATNAFWENSNYGHTRGCFDDEIGNVIPAMRAALDAAAAVDGDPVDIRTVTAYESGFEAGKNEAGDAQWKKIETAPKDREILACDITTGWVIAAKWSEYDACGNTSKEGFWMSNACADGCTEIDATHWMPLPEPPSAH